MGSWNWNWYVKGRSLSNHREADQEKVVLNSTPDRGLMENIPGRGAVLVVMVTLDEEGDELAVELLTHIRENVKVTPVRRD